MDSKTFNTKLAGVIKSAKTQRDNVQELITAALVHYQKEGKDGKPTGDTVYMNKLMRACIGVRSLPSRTISDYIKAHANVGWGKLKDGQPGFKKIGKDVQVEMPQVTWYDWTGGEHNKVPEDYDALKSIQGAITKAFNMEEKGQLKEGQHEKLARIKAIMEE